MRQEPHASITLGQTEDGTRERSDRDFLRAADIEDLAIGLGRLRQTNDRSYRIKDVGETPRLLAIAVDGQRHPTQRCLHQPGYHHAILARLTRPHEVEEPDDHHRNTPLPLVREGEKFVDELGTRVQPASNLSGPNDAVGVLLQRGAVVLAEDLRRRGDHDRRAAGRRTFQHQLGGVDVRLNRLQGTLHDALDADRGGQVIDHVRLASELSHQGGVQHRTAHELKPGVRAEVGNVLR